MRLWITKDEEGLCLWRTKPALNEDGVWWEDDEDYEEINSYIYYSLTNYADLPQRRRNHRNRCYSCSSFPTIRE